MKQARRLCLGPWEFDILGSDEEKVDPIEDE